MESCEGTTSSFLFITITITRALLGIYLVLQYNFSFHLFVYFEFLNLL